MKKKKANFTLFALYDIILIMDIKKTRQHIQSIDRQIIKLLVKRFILIKKVINYKMKNNIPVKNTNYEDKLLKKYTNIKKSINCKEFISYIFKDIFKNSRYIQSKIKN